MQSTGPSAPPPPSPTKCRRDSQFQLLLPPELSVVLFTRIGWSSEQYAEWSKRRAGEGRYLVVPTSWRGEPCLRICIVHPLTELGEIVGILDDLVSYQPA